MRLRRSTVGGPGVRRIRRGRGFSYVDATGEPVTEREILDRIQALVIPPAWKNVWICPYPNGHIQAVGTDAAGRRQYLYHQQWQADRAEEKYDRTLSLARRLPDWRAQVLIDLRGRGLAVTGCVEFDYPAKSGVRRTVSMEDPLVVCAVRTLLRADTSIPRLLVYRNSEGWGEVRADDVRARFREMVGDAFSLKDLRTWHGTVIAAERFAFAPEPRSKTTRKRAKAQVMRAVAEELGNTPAVARASYVDPRLVRAYEEGVTVSPALRRARRLRTPAERQHLVERATARLINRIERGRAW